VQRELNRALGPRLVMRALACRRSSRSRLADYLSLWRVCHVSTASAGALLDELQRRVSGRASSSNEPKPPGRPPAPPRVALVRSLSLLASRLAMDTAPALPQPSRAKLATASLPSPPLTPSSSRPPSPSSLARCHDHHTPTVALSQLPDSTKTSNKWDLRIKELACASVLPENLGCGC